MNIIDLFWQLDVSDNMKYLIIFGSIVLLCAYCALNGFKTSTKKKENNDTFYNQYTKLNKLTDCQQNYINCINNNNDSDKCYPCLQNGDYSNFFFDPKKGQWIAINKT